MSDDNQRQDPPIQGPPATHAQPAYYAPPPGSDTMGKLVPVKNPKALVAYYCAVFSIVPCFTPILGPVAIVLGILGLQDIKRQPELPGRTHAIVGIVLGGIMTFLLLVLGIIIAVAAKKS